MSLIIATGTNLGDRESNLINAKNFLQKHFQLIAMSRIYTSKAQNFNDQPDFLNQVLEFELPKQTAQETMQQLLNLELQMGRVREKKYGPRIIDMDLIFFGLETSNTDFLTLPHPRWSERSFVVRPLTELPFADQLKQVFNFPTEWTEEAFVYQK